MSKVQVSNIRQADDNHQVVTVEGGGHRYMRSPCATCPWRKDAVGEFPAEAFRLSAHTAYDGAMEGFACHTAGTEAPATCAGFLLKNAVNNIGTRLRVIDGSYDPRNVSDGGHELFDSYREMAVANGVDERDPVLRRCRANDE